MIARRHGANWLAAVVAAVLSLSASAQIRIQVQGGGLDSGKPEPAPSYPSDQALVRSVDEAKKRLSERAFPQAAVALQQVFNSPEETWIQASDKSWRSASSTAERMLLEEPALMAAYRSQFEHEAAAELKEAGEDPSRLASVMRRFFLTPSGGEATERLATLLLDAGKPNLAESYLDRLLNCPVHQALHSPRLRLKDMVARKLVGVAAPKELKVAAARESAVFGGKETPIADLLGQLDAKGDRSSETLADWPLPTGNAARTAQSSGGLPLLGAEQTSMSRPITDNKKLIAQFEKVAERNRRKNRSTYFGAQPILVGNAAYLRTCRGVEALDLRSGKPLWPSIYSAGEPIDKQELVFDEWEDAGRAFNSSAMESFICGNTLYGTLTSDGKRIYLVDELYVQPGSYNLFMLGREKGDAAKRTCNRLTALDAATGKAVWTLGGSEARKSNDPNGQLFFFGPPTPYGGKLYVVAELQSEVGLWEIDPENGRPTWKQRLLLMHRRVDADPFRRSQTCTVVASEGVAVCPTNTSRLFAVDLVSKSVLWERDFDADLAQKTNLNFNFIDVVPPPENPHLADPPIIVGSRVVFQGPNLQGVHCLELRSGQTSWRKDRAADQHVAGVLLGKALIVGAGRLRAVNLEDGDEAWSTSIPTPSGRGVFANGKYLFPTDRGDCLAIDVATGKTVGTSLSIEHPNRPLGNLAAKGDSLVALGRNGFRVYPLVDLIRKEATEALAKNGRDPRGLYLSGLISIHEQKLEDAATKLLESLGGGAAFKEREQAAKTLLRLASEENLGDFKAMDSLLVELRKVAKEPRDRAAVLRMEARAHLNAGRWSEALLAAEAQASCNDIGLIQSIADSSSRDPWLWNRSFVRRVFEAAPGQSHAEIIRTIEKRHAATAMGPDLDSLKHVAMMYDRLAIGRRAWLSIGRRQLARRRLDLASLAYSAALRGSPNEEEKATAYAGLSATADAGRLPIDAYWNLERWKQEAPGGRDADGRTVAQAMAEFVRANGSAAPTPPEPKRWLTAGMHTKVEPTVDRRIFAGRSWIKPIGSDSPYFQNRAFAFKKTESVFVSMNLATARMDHETALGEETIRSSVDVVQGTAPVLGYVYFAALDDKIAAVSVLDRGSLLWHLAPGLPDSFKDELDVISEWSQFEGRRFSDAIQIGPVGPDFVVVNTSKELLSLDPTTGKPLWRRSDVGTERRTFGDSEHLYVVGPKGEYIVVRPSDGEKITQGRWKWVNDPNKLLCRGRCIQRTSPRGSDDLEIRLWDPVTDKDVWKRTFPKGSRRWSASATEPIAVATPEGKVEILDDATGATLSSFTLDKPLASTAAIRAFRQGESLLASIEDDGGRVMERGAFNGIESRAINGKLLLLNHGESKPAWEASLKNSRVLGWPLDSLPVVAAMEMPERPRNTEATTTTFRVFEKSTGRKLIESSLPSEMQTIIDVALEGRRSRIDFSGWSKKLQLWFGEAPKAAEKKSEGATIEDVGDLAGKFFGRINNDKSPPPKAKK